MGLTKTGDSLRSDITFPPDLTLIIDVEKVCVFWWCHGYTLKEDCPANCDDVDAVAFDVCPCGECLVVLDISRWRYIAYDNVVFQGSWRMMLTELTQQKQLRIPNEALICDAAMTSWHDYIDVGWMDVLNCVHESPNISQICCFTTGFCKNLKSQVNRAGFLVRLCDMYDGFVCCFS